MNPFSLPDVQSERPDYPLYIDRVGIKNVKRRIIIEAPKGRLHYDAVIDVFPVPPFPLKIAICFIHSSVASHPNKVYDHRKHRHQKQNFRSNLVEDQELISLAEEVHQVVCAHDQGV